MSVSAAIADLSYNDIAWIWGAERMTQIFSEEQFKRWGAGRFKDAYADPPKDANYYKVPVDSGRKLVAADLAIRLFEGETVVVWVKVAGVWESCENRCLSGLVRSALGETRKVEEAPVHVFDPADSEDAVAVLAMCLYFFWDVAVAGDRGGLTVYFSHDEWFCSFGDDAERVAWAKTVFDAHHYEPC